MFGKTHSAKPAESRRMASHRRQRPRRRAARFDHRAAPARQAQAYLHAAHGRRRQHRDRQRREGGAHGRKREEKVYYHYTGYIGGIKERTAKAILEGKFPERIVEKAVERMLPRGPLGRKQLSNLRVYKGADHPHAAQAPTPRRRQAQPQE